MPPRDPSDTWRLTKMVKIPRATHMMVTSGSMTRNTPMLVAIPFLPLSLSRTLKLLPSTAARPARATAQAPRPVDVEVFV